MPVTPFRITVTPLSPQFRAGGGNLISEFPKFGLTVGRSRIIAILSRPDKGAFRDRHEREAGCGGRFGAFDEWRQGGRRSRVVLTPRRWRQVGENKFSPAMVARKPGHQGEREGNR